MMNQDKSDLGKAQVEYPEKRVGIWLGLGIFLIPYLFSWVTLRKGYSRLAKGVSFGWLALVLLPLISDEGQIDEGAQSVVEIKSEAVSKDVEKIGSASAETAVSKTPEERFLEHFPICAVRVFNIGNYSNTSAYRYSVDENWVLTVEEMCIKGDIASLCDTSGFQFKDSYQMEFRQSGERVELRGPTVLHASFTGWLPRLHSLKLTEGISEDTQPKVKGCGMFR